MIDLKLFWTGPNFQSLDLFIAMATPNITWCFPFQMITVSFEDHEELGLDPRPIKDKVKGGFVYTKTNIGLQTFLR